MIFKYTVLDTVLLQYLIQCCYYSHHTIYQLSKTYSSFNCKFVPFDQHIPISPPLSPWKALLYYLFLWVLNSTKSEFTWHFYFFVWFISSSILPSRSMLIIANDRITSFFMAEYMYVCVYIYIHTYVHIKCTWEYRYLLEKVISSSPHFTFTSFRSGIAGYMVILFLTFLRNLHATSKVAKLITFPPKYTRDPVYSHHHFFFFLLKQLYERSLKIIVR